MTDRDSANEVLRAAIFSAFCAGVEACRQNAGGAPNVLVRDLSAIHSNTSFSDLPEAVQKALRDSTDQTFRKLLQAGYSVVPKSEVKSPPRKITGGHIPKPRQGKMPSPPRGGGGGR